MFNRKAIRINDEVTNITIKDIVKKFFGMNKRISPEELFGDITTIQKSKRNNPEEKMKNYVFEFEINGDLDLKLDNLKYIELLSIDSILELSNSHCMSVKAIGIRNDDGSIEYFKDGEIK